MSAILSAATDAEVGGERVLIVAESFGGSRR